MDGYIEQTQPFRLAKDEANKPVVGTILYNCAEALRVASVMLWPFLPGKVEKLWGCIRCSAYTEAVSDRGRGDLNAWSVWGGLRPGTSLRHVEPLFPRHQHRKAQTPPGH